MCLAGGFLLIKNIWGWECRSYLAVVVVNVLTLISPVWYMLRESLGETALHIMQSAEDLGDTFAAGFRKCLCPLMLPAMLSAWLVSYIILSDDFLTTQFVGGGGVVNAQTYIYAVGASSIGDMLGFCLCSICASGLLVGMFLLVRKLLLKYSLKQ